MPARVTQGVPFSADALTITGLKHGGFAGNSCRYERKVPNQPAEIRLPRIDNCRTFAAS